MPSTRTPTPAKLSAQSQTLVDRFHLEDIVSHLLRRAHFMAEERFNAEFAGESITPRQKAALIVVSQHPGLTQNALAGHLFMDRNTVAEMVKRLCASGMLIRTSAQSDQRAYQLYLGSEGAELLERVLPRDFEVERKLLERLPEEYRPLFLKCLKLIVSPEDEPDSAGKQVPGTKG
ncbi:MarR family winged helix-turn-helix transcriptional regulator [Pseudomonas japonica]|uniref:MarR family winged helix-turn-helix transcriptional regulator n=1 Tax=Pseudomonas japonica TaxID=256466 RepID=UPI0015E46D15|nr:MarR family winged helix-turn-helix transcriptional regulator [Pseudomonas japonica]MBA1291628.1 winged helix-turn-helix transcriptional regulator [Pseudomonas japonica]